LSNSTGIDKFEILLFVILIITTVLGVYWGFTNPEFFANHYMMEDGLIEYATVVVLLMGCLVVGYRWWKHGNARPLKLTLISFVIIGFFFFVAGEELSWGQRIFGLETTDYFKENNDQEELNLHNLVVGEVKINKLLFGVILTTAILIYLVVVPLLYQKVRRIRRLLDIWYVPIPRIRHSVAYLLLLLIISLIPAAKKWELLEFGSVLIFFMILWSPWNKDRLKGIEIKTKTL
jgi:hypothetical protein